MNAWNPMAVGLLWVGCAATASCGSAPPANTGSTLPVAESTNVADLTAEDMLIQEGDLRDAPPAVTEAEARADITLLIYALRNGYGGRNHVPRAALDSAVNQLQTITAECTNGCPPAQLCARVNDAFLQIADNHLAARLNGQTHNPTLDQARFPRGSVGPNSGVGTEGAWSFAASDAGDYGVLSIREFPLHEDAVWDGYVDAVNEAMKLPALIVDLRGNGGGDDTMGFRLASMLYGAELPYPMEGIKSLTPATLALKANNPRYKILRRELRNEDVPAHLMERLESRLREYQRATNGELPREERRLPGERPPFNPSTGFDRPVFVLIDRECQSSCESSLQVLLQHPRVRTVGENTGGFIHFGNMGFVLLRNSQVLVQMATDFWRDPNGGYFEQRGLAPSVSVQAGDDAMDVALELLRERGPTP